MADLPNGALRADRPNSIVSLEYERSPGVCFAVTVMATF